MHFIDTLPVPAVFLVTAVLVLLSCELGLFIGNRHEQTNHNETPVSANVNIALSLLAFMLAFVFGVVAERFNDRRILVIDEANSINTTYMRAHFLPSPQKEKIKKLLKRYVELRLGLTTEMQHHVDRERLKQTVDESGRLQQSMWKETVACGSDILNANHVTLFVESLNNAIELQSKRIAAGLYARLPDIVWIVLYLMIMLAMVGLGYQFGCARKRNWTTALVVAASFGLVLMMIADLERPFEGFVQTNVQPMIDEGKRMGLPQSDFPDGSP